MGEEYVAIEIEELPDGSLQGYSPVLNLNIRWESGELVFYDPATGRPIVTLEDERERAETERSRADSAEARVVAERSRAARAEARAVAEGEARAAAEARVRELEEQLRRREP